MTDRFADLDEFALLHETWNATALAARTPLLALDLPGHGESAVAS